MSETKFLYTWVVIIYRSIVTLAGIPGNLLILSVYWNKTTLGSAHVFIVTLALCDLYSCLIIPLEIHYWLEEYNYTNTFLCKLLFTWGHIGWNLSACITTAIAWDRYLAVSQPVNRRLIKKKAVKICVLSAVVVVVVAATTVAFSSYIETNVTISGTDIVNGTRCNPRSNHLVSKVLVFVLQYSYFFVTFVVTITLYAKLWNRMNKRCTQIKEEEPSLAKNRNNKHCVSNTKEDLEMRKDNHSLKKAPNEIVTEKESKNTKSVTSLPGLEHNTSRTVTVEESMFLPGSSSSRPVMTIEGGKSVRQDTKCMEKVHNSKGKSDHDNRIPNVENNTSEVHNRVWPMSRLTKMLLLTTLVFVCTWSLSLIIYMIDPFTEKFPRQSIGYTIIVMLRVTGLINHAINPVLYSFMNPKFRGDCKELFKRLRRRLC